MSKYKLVDGVLIKDEKVTYCPEKGVVQFTTIDEKKQNLSLNGGAQAQIKQGFQQFYCHENCAKFQKNDPNAVDKFPTALLACCGLNVRIDSEEHSTKK